MKPELWAVELGQGMGVIRLGDTRQEVVRKLREAGIDVDDEEKDRWFYVGEMDTELLFKTTSPQVLLEIAVEDERLRLGPLPVIGERLHKVVELLKVPDAETVWRADAGDDDEGPTDGSRPLVTDEILLDGGTLWIPSLGLGLGMVRGEICTVCLRQPGESPRRGDGPLTASQRELSARKDLPTYLIRPRGGAQQASWFQTLLTFALFGAIGLLVWQAIDYQRRWNEAPVVPGDVLDVQPPPPDPFPTEYTIAYRDQAGTAHQVVLKRADVYLAPKVGENVEIRFLPESPAAPLGPARYRDIAVEKYVPLVIGIIAIYLVILIIVPVAQWLLRGNRRAV
jgi:hypothetical protein